MSLNDWNQMFYDIYYPKNFARGPYPLLIHVFEVFGGLGTSFAKAPVNVSAIREYVPKCFAWYCGLARQMQILDLQNMLWSKYPGVCAYCRQKVCNCQLKHDDLDIAALFKTSSETRSQMPKTLNEWLRMFNNIYGPRNCQMQPAQLLTKVLEELGELCEAVRIAPYQPMNLMNEMADVLSWFFGIVNYLNSTLFKTNQIDLGQSCWQTYLNRCSTCKRKPCACSESYVSRRVSEPGPFSTTIGMLDPLLSIYNRQKMDQDLTEMVNRARLDSDVLSVIMIDVDDFKKINDNFGMHTVGDKVLQEISERIKQESLGKGEVYRYGGEEILVLMYGFNADEAKGTAERIRKRVRGQPFQHPEDPAKQIAVTISCGIAECPRHSTDSSDLVKKADKAMYNAKDAGKDRVVIFGE
jgi:diguanylate cyclase (GGDEF)-like protein